MESDNGQVLFRSMSFVEINVNGDIQENTRLGTAENVKDLINSMVSNYLLHID